MLAHREKLSLLAETGCIFVTTAVEEVDNEILYKLEKSHTRVDFVEVVNVTHTAGLTLSPTFIPFHPWTTTLGFIDLLSMISELNLIENVSPVQLGIRLLIPEGSRILELKDINQFLGDFDAEKLSYNWESVDPLADEMESEVNKAIQLGVSEGASRRGIFEKVWILAHNAFNKLAPALPPERVESTIPTLSEPWYCCAEPNDEQIAGM